MRLQSPQLGAIEPFQPGEAVRTTAFSKGAQSRNLRVVSGDNHLAADFVSNSLLTRVRCHQPNAGYRQPRLFGAGRVIEASVQNPAIVTRLVLANSSFFLQYDDALCRSGRNKSVSCGEADDAPSDHCYPH